MSHRRLLGIHCIGAGATGLVHVDQAVLALDAGLDYFLGTVFNYPTLAECDKVAALDASNKLRRRSSRVRPAGHRAVLPGAIVAASWAGESRAMHPLSRRHENGGPLCGSSSAGV